MNITSIVLAFQLVAASDGAATLTISVTNFGVRPNSRENAVLGVRKALEACRQGKGATLVFPKGRYDFWAQHSEELAYFESNTTDNNLKICPVVLRDLQSGHADGFQVSNCRGHIVVDGCKFEGLMDDPINVHGTSVKIVEMKHCSRLVKDNTIKHNTQFKPWQGRKAMLPFEACKQVEVSGNKIADDALGKNIALVKMQPSELTLTPGQGMAEP